MTREDEGLRAFKVLQGHCSDFMLLEFVNRWQRDDLFRLTDAMLQFADAEAAAMRQRCAKAADDAADHEGPFTEYFRGRDQGCHDAATAIRALPATGEVGRG